MWRGEMNDQGKEKFTVEFREGVTEYAPVIPRRYTYIQEKESNISHLIIASDFISEQFTKEQKEIIGEWLLVDSGTWFYGYLFMGDLMGQEPDNQRRAEIQKLLVNALVTIRKGDRKFFESHPELLHYPIIVYYLYSDPEYNYSECWGTFNNYDITTAQNMVETYSIEQNLVLIQNKLGDVTGNGKISNISLYGNKTNETGLFDNITVKVDMDGTQINMLTEINAYNPTIFIGDFTHNHINDIMVSSDIMFDSMNLIEKGMHGISIESVIGNELVTIFTSGSYSTEYQFLVNYDKDYKVNIINIKKNKLFNLDISNKGKDYLSNYYKENGELIKPVQGKVLNAEAFVPLVSNKKEVFYDMFVIQRIIGEEGIETLGFIQNQLSWNGKKFDSVWMVVLTPSTNLLPS